MPVTINANGTSVPYFMIGKRGTTLYQGTSDPNPTYTMKSGDMWVDTSSNLRLNIWNGSAWQSPVLSNIFFNDTSITTNSTTNKNLTLSGNRATSGSTDTDGGSLLLSGGTSTGTGGSIITFSTATAGTTGTTDRSPTEKMRITADGRVGIGTTTPSFDLSFGGNKDRYIFVEKSDTGGGRPLVIQPGASADGSTDSNGGNLSLRSGDCTGAGISEIVFSTVNGTNSGTTRVSPTEKMRITAIGNIMIGGLTGTQATYTITFRSHPITPTSISIGMSSKTLGNGDSLSIISGPCGSTADALAGDLILSTGSSRGTGAGNVVFSTPTPGTTGTTINNASEKMRITGPGNVGIGTTTPSYILSMGGNSARTIGMERHSTANTAGNSLTLLAGSATSGATDKDGGSLLLSGGTSTGTGGSIITFSTATAGTTGTTDRSPTEKMRITAAGNVGIGTTSPSTLLSVNGTSTFTGTASFGGSVTPATNVVDSVGYTGMPQNSQTANYTTVAADAGKTIVHPITDNNARTFTIASNASVPYPIGTAFTFVNMINSLTIAITSDTMYLASTGTTGSRTLAAYGIATAIKVTSTSWIISGVGLT